MNLYIILFQFYNSCNVTESNCYRFEETAKRMGVPAVNCLVIEDSLVGVKAATAAKTKVVAVPSRGESDCCKLANITLNSLLEFQPELWGLPPFDDCNEPISS